MSLRKSSKKPSRMSKQSGQPRGRFITIEGVEGVGKSTNIERMREFLVSKDIEVVCTREPGGTPISEKIRQLLLDPDNAGMDAVTELMLMFAARRQHVEGLIRPALAAGTWVISDRFTDSTYAYQGGGRGIAEALIRQLEDLALDGFQPDMTVLLDLDVHEGLKRARKLGDADRFELEEGDFFNRVRQTFLQRAQMDKPGGAGADAGQGAGQGVGQGKEGRYRIVDASQSLEDVEAALRDILAELIIASTDRS